MSEGTKKPPIDLSIFMKPAQKKTPEMIIMDQNEVEVISKEASQNGKVMSLIGSKKGGSNKKESVHSEKKEFYP